LSVVDALHVPVADVPAIFGTQAFTVEIPLAILGPDDGALDALVLMGNISGPTDCVPNQEHMGIYHISLPVVLRSH
jgi:hypothetical protein